ncbi:HotDog domain-containing protein [Phyllosticta citribraziliensis]|uniref:HotDog domain-containing protein n=1 Tax=Phyllosticta citribraziliensis TaxID=989973 RepID=A0ABR1LDP3_9PEZI
MASPAAPAPTTTTTAAADVDADADAADAEATLAHVRAYWLSIVPKSPIYGFLFSGLTITSASSSGHMHATLPLSSTHVNSKSSLHGSVSATLVDLVGGLAITAAGRREKNGVSVDMHLSFVSGAREGDVLEVEGVADKVGGSLAFTRVVLRKVVQGKGRGEWPVVARGSHTKFVR